MGNNKDVIQNDTSTHTAGQDEVLNTEIVAYQSDDQFDIGNNRAILMIGRLYSPRSGFHSHSLEKRLRLLRYSTDQCCQKWQTSAISASALGEIW